MIVIVHADVGSEPDKELTRACEDHRVVDAFGAAWEVFWIMRPTKPERSGDQRRSFELNIARNRHVTDDGPDAPDGARVGDWVRVGRTWVLDRSCSCGQAHVDGGHAAGCTAAAESAVDREGVAVRGSTAMARKTRDPMTPEALRRRLGKNLERLMAERGLTEEDVAVKLGWTSPTPAHGASNLRNKYIRGDAWPQPKLLVDLADALGVDPSELLAP